MAYLALFEAIFIPRLTYNHRIATRIDQPDVLELWIELATFLDGKSILEVQLWHAKTKIQLDLYGDNNIVLPMPEPSWSEADEQRRQQLLTEKRIAPIGTVKVAEENDKVDSTDSGTTDVTPPAPSTERFLEKYAGPPSDQMKAL
jgi:hypothetical protein